MSWLRVGCVIVLIGLCTAGRVSAEPDAATLKKASNHFKLGQEFFKSRQWDRAIAEYQSALDLTGEPLMVFNIALAHDRAGRSEEALAGFLRYLELSSDGAIADEARQDVARLTPIVDKIRANRAADHARMDAEAKRAQVEAKRRAEAEQQAKLDDANRARLEIRAESIAGRGRIQRWTGVAFAGAGLVGIGLGVKLGLDAQTISDELEAHQGAWTDAQIARLDEGRSANTRSIVLSAVGGGAILTGVVIYMFGRGNVRRAERMRVDARATAGGGSVSLAVTF
jgi:tetratricopeptide (TPR) repeat protein